MNPNEHLPVAFIFCTSFASAAVLREYRKIAAATRGLGDAWLLLQADAPRLPKDSAVANLHVASLAEILAMGFPMIGPGLIPGHVHFPLLHFFWEHPGYRYYWFIEYDVRFSGDWRVIFSAFSEVDVDLVTAHVYPYSAEPDWERWELSHPRLSMELGQRFRSMSPIYRISASALEFIRAAHADGWRGHFEVLLPSLLIRGGFSVVDFGGSGPFVPPGMQDRFYLDAPPNRKGLLDRGTLRYRPAFLHPGFRRNKLYHPVKSAAFVAKERIRMLLEFLFSKPGADKLIRFLKSFRVSRH